MAVDPLTLYGIISGSGMLLNHLFNRGNDKASRQAMRGQLELSRGQLDLAKRMADVDMPYRANLFKGLSNRMSQQAPVYKSGRIPISNPYINVMQSRLTPPGSLAGALARVAEWKRPGQTYLSPPPALLPPSAGGT